MSRCSRRTTLAVRSGLAGLALLVATGCSSGDEPDATPVHVPGASTPTDDAGGSTSPRETPGEPSAAVVTTGAVRVNLRLGDRSGPAAEALRTFLLARTRSIIAKAPSAALRQVSSPAEYARQRAVITDARRRGLTVPTRPEVVVMESRAPRRDRALLGVCLWLPSTEFVDELTGVSPAGPVPAEWLPAVAHLSKRRVTWVVDTLRSPTTEFTPDCGGLA